MSQSSSKPFIKFHRKLFHFSSVWVPILYFRSIERETGVLLAAVGFLLIAGWELLRLSWPRFNELCLRKLHLLVRADESKSFTTSTYFALAVFLCVFLFDKNVATAALLFLAVGDPVAALIGAQYGGKARFLGKSFQGSAACWIACFVPASLVVGVWIAFWGALAATLFELLSSRINDNLSIPIFSGLVMSMIPGSGEIETPLQILLVIFQVYLYFVILTCLVGIIARHTLVWLYRREEPDPPAEGGFAPMVSVLKPLQGCGGELHDNLVALCRQDYPGEVEIICSAEDPGDPGLLVAKLVQDEQPGANLRIVTSAPAPGRHGKISNLIAAMQEARGEVILVSDADVRPTPAYIQRLVAPLADPEIGLVTAVPAYQEVRSLAVALKSLTTTYLTTSIYVPLAYFGRLDTALGSTFAVGRTTLEEVGGFEAVARHMADDHALARAIHHRGGRIHLTRWPVHIHSEAATLRSWWNQTRRRMVMLRTYMPDMYPVYLFQSGLFHALALALLLPGPGASLLLTVTVLAEILSMGLLNRLFARDPWTYGWLWLAPVLQLVGPVIWASAFFSRVVVWGGRRYYVDSSGIVTRLQAPDAVEGALPNP